MDELPNNVTPISTLIINRNKRKECTCIDRRFEIDTVNNEILCASCGVIVDPFDAMLDIATRYERINQEVQHLLDQRKQILNWKPHLLTVRKIEQIYRGSMILSCPHCGRGILADELTHIQVNKQSELQRRNNEDHESKR